MAFGVFNINAATFFASDFLAQLMAFFFSPDQRLTTTHTAPL